MNEEDELRNLLTVESPILTRGQAILLLIKILDNACPPDDISDDEFDDAWDESPYNKIAIKIIGKEFGDSITYYDILKPLGVTQEEISACVQVSQQVRKLET